MKSTIIKRVLTVTLATTMVVGMSLTAFAGTTEAASSSAATVTVSETPDTPIVIAPSDDAAPAPTEGSNTVAGVKSSVVGQNFATAVDGLATVTPKDTIASSFGLAAGATPYVKASNFDTRKSTLCNACIDYMVTALGVTRGPSFNIEYGQMKGGVYTLLPSDGTPIIETVGVPRNFRTPGANMGVLKVSSAGIEVLPDYDSNDATVTFVTTGGRATYTLIK